LTLEITSSSNKHIKHIKSLQRKKYRDKYNEFVIEGLRIVEHGLENDAEISTIYYTNKIYCMLQKRNFFEKIKKRNIALYKINDKILKEISNTENSQGIVGIVKKKSFDLQDIINKEEFFLIVLDRLQDPGNVGTIIRTADAAGAEGIIAAKGTVDIYNSKTIRATMGSVFTMPVVYEDDILKTISILRNKGADIISTTLDTEKYHHEVKYGKKNVIIIGNEGNGICGELIEKSNIKVKIPLIGNAESLNASVASGIVMYEIVRQKMNSEN